MKLATLKSTSLVLLALVTGLATASASETVELPVWSGTAPGSEGIDEKELVVDRGKGKGYVDRSFSNVHRPTLTVHLPKLKGQATCAAVIICPGGAFNRVVLDKEGNDFARLLNKQGIAGIVLKYRTVKSKTHYYGISAPIADLKRSVRLTRFRAAKWKIDPNRVGVFGMSAGGHIAASVTTRFDKGDASAEDPVARLSCRPDFAGFAYPAISMQTGVASKGLQKTVLGDSPSVKLINERSSELHVNANTPPSFLCHAEDDGSVPAEHSRRFAAACKKAGVECTTFIRAKGGHGFGVRQQGNPINEWPKHFVAWLVKNQFATAD